MGSYVERPRRLIIRAGESFSCDNDHPYAVAKHDIYGPDIARHTDFDFAAGQAVKSPEPIRCKICGGQVWSLKRYLFRREELGDLFNRKTAPFDENRHRIV